MGRKRKKPVESEKLSYVLGIRISESEREMLVRRAVECGFPDTGKYCRSILRDSNLMNWSDLNRELRKIKYQILNLESILKQIEKNAIYGSYPVETQHRFQECVCQMQELSKKLEELLEDQEKNGEG